MTWKTTIQLSYKSIGESSELPSIHAALESVVSPITARTLTLMVLDAAEDMGKGTVLLERKEEDEETEGVQDEEREEVEKDSVRKESLEFVLDVRAGRSGYTLLMFSGVNKRAI